MNCILKFRPNSGFRRTSACFTLSAAQLLMQTIPARTRISTVGGIFAIHRTKKRRKNKEVELMEQFLMQGTPKQVPCFLSAKEQPPEKSGGCGCVGWSVNWNLYLDMGIRVLPMFFRIFSILNSKLGTTVQTTQTHDTFVLDPNRLFVPHFNRLHRAFSGA